MDEKTTQTTLTVLSAILILVLVIDFAVVIRAALMAE
jgi:hypothetical protein